MNLIGQLFLHTCFRFSQSFYHHSFIPSSWPQTHIIFVSKIKNPMQISHFRPIALSNVNFRILIKVLANRLKHVHKDLSNRERSICVPGYIVYMVICLLLNKLFILPKANILLCL